MSCYTLHVKSEVSYRQEIEGFLTRGEERLGALLHMTRSKIVERNMILVYSL